MRKLVVLAGVVLMMLIGCQDVTIGFLNIENASYDPDTIFLKSVLDTAETKVMAFSNTLLYPGFVKRTEIT